MSREASILNVSKFSLISGMNCGINILSIAGEDSDRKDKQVD